MQRQPAAINKTRRSYSSSFIYISFHHSHPSPTHPRSLSANDLRFPLSSPYINQQHRAKARQLVSLTGDKSNPGYARMVSTVTSFRAKSTACAKRRVSSFPPPSAFTTQHRTGHARRYTRRRPDPGVVVQQCTKAALYRCVGAGSVQSLGCSSGRNSLITRTNLVVLLWVVTAPKPAVLVSHLSALLQHSRRTGLLRDFFLFSFFSHSEQKEERISSPIPSCLYVTGFQKFDPQG